MLSPAQILERLDDRFTLLTGGRRRTRGRQQTLETAIGWSYDLLGPDEQDALRRVSVMPAAFDLDLAAAVLGRTATAALDLLESLTAQSLLHTTRDDRSTQLRYRLLETIRAYAHQRLVDAGAAEETRDRHAHHIADRLDGIAVLPVSMRPAHYPLADDAIAAIDWAQSRNDTTLGARLVCGAVPIFISRGLFDKGVASQEWAARVEDAALRSKVYYSRSILTLAATAGREVARFSDLALQAAGDLAVPWRAGPHVLRAMFFAFSDDEAFSEEARLARDALRHPDAIGAIGKILDVFEADWHMWHGNYPAAIEQSDRARRDPEIEPLTAMNLHGAHLLALVLADDPAGVAAHLRDPAVGMLRATWLEAARRGEHWLLSYEAIRAAALGSLGEHQRARRDLAAAVGLLDVDRMVLVDADLLGAFAWVCIGAGERDRAATLLDDTWWTARSPNTYLLLITAHERIHGVVDGDPARSRSAERQRRNRIRDAIDREHRTRRALDSELDRLGLTP